MIRVARRFFIWKRNFPDGHPAQCEATSDGKTVVFGERALELRKEDRRIDSAGRRGKKVTTERRFMPGYVLVHMEMSDQGYHLVNSINRVTGFLGPQGRPMPMRDAEVNGILNRVEEGVEAPRTLIFFEIGEQVSVTDGPFEGFDGTVEEVDDDNQRLKVTVSIFGRATPVELEYTQVAKQS